MAIVSASNNAQKAPVTIPQKLFKTDSA